METENIYLSYNVGSNSSLAGLQQLCNLFKPLIIFLQEITISTEQLLAQVGSEYTGICNVDEQNPSKPGNAVLWKKGLEVVVTNGVVLRLQLIKNNAHGNF